jgi:hypothetical protein
MKRAFSLFSFVQEKILIAFDYVAPLGRIVYPELLLVVD